VTEIQQNRWDQLVRRVANVVGGASQVNDTLNELFPVLDVENVPGELLYLSGMRLSWCGSALQASVGNTNHHQLFNPAGSQVLATITGVHIHSTTNQSFRMAATTTALANSVGNVILRDLRNLTDVPSCQNRNVQQAGGIPLITEWRALASVMLHIADPNGIQVLFPGTGLTVATVGTNIVSTVNWFWRERVFEPAEVNF